MLCPDCLQVGFKWHHLSLLHLFCLDTYGYPIIHHNLQRELVAGYRSLCHHNIRSPQTYGFPNFPRSWQAYHDPLHTLVKVACNFYVTFGQTRCLALTRIVPFHIFCPASRLLKHLYHWLNKKLNLQRLNLTTLINMAFLVLSQIFFDREKMKFYIHLTAKLEVLPPKLNFYVFQEF